MFLCEKFIELEECIKVSCNSFQSSFILRWENLIKAKLNS